MRYYDIGGQKLPSVTSILGYLPDPPGLANWKATNPEAERIFREAAVIGTLTHFRVENFLAKRCGLPQQRVELHPSSPPITAEMIKRVTRNFAAFCQLDEKYRFTPVNIELTVHNPMLGYAGTVDMVCIDPSDGARVLVDIKTGKGIYEKYRAQLWAYMEALAFMGERVERCVVLRLGDKDAEYTTVVPDPDTFFQAYSLYLDKN